MKLKKSRSLRVKVFRKPFLIKEKKLHVSPPPSIVIGLQGVIIKNSKSTVSKQTDTIQCQTVHKEDKVNIFKE